MVARKAIAIIPARGGSRRIPRKNIIPFEGRPMIAWTIEAALESSLFERVLVSTEDDVIANTSRQWGADVPFLRDCHYDDHTPSSAATLSALEQVETILAEQYDIVAQLMANCPLRGSEHIRDAMAAFVKSEADYQISCSKYGWLNPWWAHQLTEDSQAKRLFGQEIASRSQDLPTLYCPTGAIWIARVNALKRSGSFYGPGYRFVPMDWRAGVDIDDEEDLVMARALYLLQKSLQPS